MSESIIGLKRSSMCADLSEADVGKKVTLMGWCHKCRDLGGLTFITLRDRTGEIQLVITPESSEEIRNKAASVRSEYVLAAVGDVQLRSAPNDKMKTGKIEIAVEDLRIISESETPPFYIEEDDTANEQLRLKYRYLDLRRPNMQRNLMLRHKIAKCARDYYDEQGFVEIETPMLGKSTPEGARDYLVPSRVKQGSFFALPQSPQLYKQLLMLAGYDRYFQIAKCFRDEDLRADRQPEFTQVDLEMSFVDCDDVMSVTEGFLVKVFKDVMNIDIETPIRRITWQEAMDRYGSDKPDLRFDIELKDISEIASKIDFMVFKGALEAGGSVRAVCIPGGAKFSRKEIDALGEVCKTYKAKGMAWLVPSDEPRGSFLKFLTPENIAEIKDAMGATAEDLICIIADKNKVVYDSLGALRIEAAKKLGLIDPKDFKLCWVTEFPMFEYSEEEGRYMAMHHPFTCPMDEDLDMLESDQGKVRSKAYDIVLNGCELGGGSIRIHDRALQMRIFKLLGFTEESAQEQFGFLLDAFKFGVPPHGGLAFGLDRMVMLMAGAASIREVIAFPKVQNSSDLMTEAPSPVADKQLEELAIKVALTDNLEDVDDNIVTD
ncbi:aspartyl-tRNA synthetase [Ruminococcaceae bacterium KH2T8]|nr:aspartyl-tRNA synthetase [Ruminococcaceae bacterium KH2T8]